MEIIDAHVHLFPNRETGQKAMRGHSPTGAWGTSEELKATLKAAEVIRAAAVATIPLRAMRQLALDKESGAGRSGPAVEAEISERMRERLSRYNQWLCEQCRSDGSLWAFVHADPSAGMDFLLEEVETRVREGARGLKLHPALGQYLPDDPSIWPLYDWAQTRGLPLIFHGGRSLESPDVQHAHPERFRGALQAFPGLRVVVAHLGNDFWEASVDLARSCPNAFFDTSTAISGMVQPPALSDQAAVKLLRAIGTDRILFASDFPWGDPTLDLKRIREMGLSDTELEAILAGNARRVLGGEG